MEHNENEYLMQQEDQQLGEENHFHHDNGSFSANPDDANIPTCAASSSLLLSHYGDIEPFSVDHDSSDLATIHHDSMFTMPLHVPTAYTNECDPRTQHHFTMPSPTRIVHSPSHQSQPQGQHLSQSFSPLIANVHHQENVESDALPLNNIHKPGVHVGILSAEDASTGTIRAPVVGLELRTGIDTDTGIEATVDMIDKVVNECHMDNSYNHQICVGDPDVYCNQTAETMVDTASSKSQLRIEKQLQQYSEPEFLPRPQPQPQALTQYHDNFRHQCNQTLTESSIPKESFHPPTEHYLADNQLHAYAQKSHLPRAAPLGNPKLFSELAKSDIAPPVKPSLRKETDSMLYSGKQKSGQNSESNVSKVIAKTASCIVSGNGGHQHVSQPESKIPDLTIPKAFALINEPRLRSDSKKRKASNHHITSLNTCQPGQYKFSRRTVPSAAKISDSIPENASSIFHVLDRRIDFDSLGDETSNYSLLRSWVRDDPYRREMKFSIGGNLAKNNILRSQERPHLGENMEGGADETKQDCCVIEDKKKLNRTENIDHLMEPPVVYSDTKICNILDNFLIGRSSFAHMSDYLKGYIREGTRKRTKRSRLMKKRDINCLKRLENVIGIERKFSQQA